MFGLSKMFNKVTDYLMKYSLPAGSCDAIAKQYFRIKQENPNKSEKEIYIKLINWLPSSGNNRKALLSVLDDGDIDNLSLFIFWTFIFNTDLKYCTSRTKQKVIEMIQKELEKYNLK